MIFEYCSCWIRGYVIVYNKLGSLNFWFTKVALLGLIYTALSFRGSRDPVEQMTCPVTSNRAIQKFAMGGRFGGLRAEHQPPEANWGLGAKPPAAGGWGFEGKAPDAGGTGVLGRSPFLRSINHIYFCHKIKTIIHEIRYYVFKRSRLEGCEVTCRSSSLAAT